MEMAWGKMSRCAVLGSANMVPAGPGNNRPCVYRYRSRLESGNDLGIYTLGLLMLLPPLSVDRK